MSRSYVIVQPSEPAFVIHGNDGSVVIHAPAVIAELHQHFIGEFEDGTVTGDFVRWNAETESWEAAAEPLEFNQIILTPAETAVLNQEGALFYCSTDKGVHVCTSDE